MTLSEPQSADLKYENICFTAKSIAETDGITVSLRIPKASIQRIRLRYGAPAKHPLVAIVVAVGLIAVGVIPLYHLICWMLYGGTVFFLEFFLASLIVIAISLIHSAVVRRYVLEVQESAGQRRLIFSKKANLASIRDLISQAERQFGYRVEIVNLE